MASLFAAGAAASAASSAAAGTAAAAGAASAAAAGTAATVAAATATTMSGAIMTGISALSSIAGGIGAYQQGKAQEKQAELSEQSIELQGRMDAVTTNDELLRTLSMNTVAAAAGGLSSTGSVQRAQEESQANAARNLNISRLNTGSKAAAERARGQAARGAGTAGILGSLVSAGTRIYGASNTIRKTG